MALQNVAKRCFIGVMYIYIIWIHRSIDRETDRQIDRQIDRQTNRQIDRWIDG